MHRLAAISILCLCVNLSLAQYEAAVEIYSEGPLTGLRLSGEFGIIDFDGDTIPDVVMDAHDPATDQHELLIMSGKSNGSYGDPVTAFVIDTIPDLKNLQIEDIDSDGLPDIIYSDPGHSHFWFKNQGENEVSPVPVELIPPQNISAYLQQIVDINMDGHPDILCYLDDGIKSITIMFNDGQGNFNDINSIPVQTFINDLSVTDIDGDGDLDIVGVEKKPISLFYQNLVLFYYINSGNLQFGPREILNIVPPENLVTYLKLDGADLDNDGQSELLLSYFAFTFRGSHNPVTSVSRFEIYDLENGNLQLTNQYNSFPHPFPVSTSGSLRNFEVTYVDGNADGLLDILTYHTDRKTVTWKIGDGDGFFPGNLHVSDPNAFDDDTYNSRFSWLITIDKEGDGDLDVFELQTEHTNTYSRLVWYESNLLLDEDGDGINNLTDCDDNNPNVGSSLPAPIIGNDTSLCVGEGLEFQMSNPIDGALYFWEGPNDFFSFESEPVLNDLNDSHSGTYALFMAVNNCSSPESDFELSVIATPEVSVSLGSNLELTAEVAEPVTYQWLADGVPIDGASSSTYTAQTYGSYSVVVVNEYGCVVTSDLVLIDDLDQDGFDLNSDCDDENGIIGDSLPPANPGSDQEICEGVSLLLSGSHEYDGVDYQWTGPGGFTGNEPQTSIENISMDQAGTYSLSVSLNECVSEGADVNIVVNDLPEIEIVFEEPDLLTIVGEHLVDFLWFDISDTLNGSTDSFLIAPSSGIFYAIATDINGCSSVSDTISVVIISTNDQLLGYPVKIYPNPLPINSELQVIIPDLQHNLQYQLVGLHGTFIISGEIATSNPVIPFRGIPAGIYLLEIRDGRQRQTFKICLFE